MALAAARRDAELAKSATVQQDPAYQVATATPSQPEAGTAAVDSAPAQPQTTATLTGALRQ
jgi:hypothetical protein